MSPSTHPRLRYLIVLALVPTLAGSTPCLAQESAPEGTREVGTVFRDCPMCPEMVVVPAGSIMMGSESLHEDGPMRRVTTAPFAVGTHEVTFAEWDACLDGGGCDGYRPPDLGWGRGRQPVVNVSWVDARSYLEWLSNETGQRYRLLRSAEWEYVAREGAGPYRLRYLEQTDDAARCEVDPDLDPEEWQPDWVGCPGRAQTAPVGSLEPNAFGLHDATGNAWEWTEDCRDDVYRWAPMDVIAMPDDCTGRQLRGGSGLLVGGMLKGVYLEGISIGSREPVAGFRVARAVTDGDGLNVALVDDGYTQLLLQAIRDDSVAIVEALLAGGADPNDDMYGDGYTPLFAAVDMAGPDIVAAMLEAGANPNNEWARYYGSGETPLHHALREGSDDLEQTVTVLLDGGADARARTNDGRTPLHAAVRHRRGEAVVSTLLDAGADSDLTALQFATLHSDSVAVASLLAQGADPNESDHVGWSPLHFAVVNDHPVATTALLDAGADPNAVDDHGDTPLIRYLGAVPDADREGLVLRALLNAGADPNKLDGSGRAPLHFATKYGVRPAVVSALLESGADPNALDEYGDPPLMNLFGNLQRWDDREGAVAIVDALLKAGADPNLGTGFRKGSPLHTAIRNPVHPAIISLLLDAGADPFARDDLGDLPIDLAEEYDWLKATEAYEQLRARGRGNLVDRLRRFFANIFG